MYSETQDYNSVMERLDDILNILLLAAGRYSSKRSMMRIHACLKSIHSQLADDKKSFQYYDIEKVKGVGKRTYGSSIDWFVNAGIALKCRNRTGIKVCEGNIERDRNGALHLPLYGACLIDGPSVPDVPSIDIDAINRMSVG